jgi:hypothetical protein
MYITGILGRPETYLAHHDMQAASSAVEALTHTHPGKYVTCVKIACETAYIVGVKGRLDMEHIYDREGEMTNKRDQLAKFYTAREVYILELKPSTHYGKDADNRPCSCHPDDHPPVPCPGKHALTECRAAAGDKNAEAIIKERLSHATHLAGCECIDCWNNNERAQQAGEQLRDLK